MDINSLLQQILALPKSEQSRLLRHLATSDSEESPVESALVEERTKNGIQCPHCNSHHVSRNGKSAGQQRYICVECGKTFSGTTNSILAYRHIPIAQIQDILDCMVDGKSVRVTAEICGINKNTAFYWRHKILDALAKKCAHETLSGIVEADETFFRISYKGNHKKDGYIMPRKAKKRGKSASFRGLSHEQVCVPCAIDRSNHVVSLIACTGRVSTKALEEVFAGHITAGATIVTDKMNSYTRFAHKRELPLVQLKTDGKAKAVVKGIYHIQNVNSYHSGLKKFLLPFNGVATKYLNNYLAWFKFLRCNKDSYNKKADSFLSEVLSAVSSTVRGRMSRREAVPVLV